MTINTNTIPQIWKTSKIIPIAKPNKNPSLPSSYRPIALLSPIAKTLEKIILPHITTNIILPTHQHGFRAAHSTTTALHQINNTILSDFNKKKTSHKTILTTLDMTKAFDTVNIHQLIHKIHNTHIPTTIIKFLANYLKGRRQYTSYNNHTSKHTNIKAVVPQGSVLSPTLFNIYLSDIPLLKISSLNLTTYAENITVTSSHPNINTATQNLLPYLNEIHTWAHNKNLQINPSKTTSTLTTADPSEYTKPLNIHINNIPVPTTSNLIIFGLTFDPKLKYSTHTNNTITKAKKNTQFPKTPHFNTLGKKAKKHSSPHTKHYSFPSSNTPKPSGHPSSHPPPSTNSKKSKTQP